MKVPTGRSTIAAAVAASIALLATTATASAQGSAGEFENFAHCLTEIPAIELCMVAQGEYERLNPPTEGAAEGLTPPSEGEGESPGGSVESASAGGPTASFTYAPTSPVVGQSVTFSAARSTCPNSPCTYTWSDDGSTTRPTSALWPLGGGQTLRFTFAGAGMKYVRLVVTDASGQTATVEHNVEVQTEASEPPPPPSAPSNTSRPTVGGAAQVGQTLTASSGTWSGSTPIAYAYRWQDCSAAGANCTNISGASASTYKLGSGDVGDTVRVVVTASNAAGATAAASASVGPVTAAAPTASFTVAPASPVVGEPVSLNASSSTCPDGPCTYTWSDDGSTTRPIPALWLLGGGQTLQFTFSGAGMKYVRLVVSDASGQTATVEHNVEVQAEAIEPPPPSAPSNTSRPTVGGAPRVGQTLTASSGTWSGSAPIAYAYQWQRDGTTNIAGATGPRYTPAASDVGHTLDVLVTASNAVGSAASKSAQTAAVTEGAGPRTGCFSAPSACGYPDPTNSGVPAGTALEAQTGKIVVNAAGTTIKDLNLNGSIEVRANNTTIEDDEITVNGTQKGCSSPCGGNAIHIVSGVSGVVVKHVTCHGGAPSGENVTTFCFRNEGEATNRYEYNQVYNTAACFWGTGIYENNYCLDNGSIPNAHYDGIYFGGGADSIVMNHNTMFQPHEQTAAIFFSHDESNPQNITITNNFLAGGGFTIYGGGSGQNEFKVLGPVTVTGNRYARCLTKEINVEGGHHVCEGGYDTHGYYPNGGSYGLYAYFNEAVTTFSNNYWDDNLEPAS